MTGLFVERSGQGQPLVMVHGWAMNSATWGELKPRLAESFAVHALELPGHGRSAWSDEQDSGAWVERAVAAAPAGAIWLGWSLGALVCLKAALRFPAHVQALVLVGGTPCFVQDARWPHAMQPEVLGQFAAQLAKDPSATVQRFLALQVKGDDGARATLRELKQAMRDLPAAQEPALVAGLAILRETDLRNELKRIEHPALWLLGERDTLVPAAMGWDLGEWMPDACVEVVAGAGHVPFLSHLSGVLAPLKRFLRGIDGG